MRYGQYLGFRITEEAEILIAPKSIARYQEKVRECWDTRQSLTSKQLVKQWRQYSIGWWSYFKIATDLRRYGLFAPSELTTA